MSTKKTTVPAELLPAAPVDAPADPELRTVNGEPIPVFLQHLVPYDLTDQGKAEAAARPGPRASVTILAEAFEKGLEQMEDEPWLETDPFKEKVDSLQGAHPGMKFHMLSRKVIDKRGKRGWEILKDAKGDPEAVGGMLVGVMPEQTAKRRNKKFQAIGNDAVKEADEAYQTQQEKIIGDGKRAGLSALRPGEVVQDSERPERAVHTGLHTQRG